MRTARPEVPLNTSPEVQGAPVESAAAAAAQPEKKNAFVEGLKTVGRKGYEIAGKVLDFNSHADRVNAKAAEMYEGYKNVTQEWQDDLVETINLRVLDKWKIMKQQKEVNIFGARKLQEMTDLHGRANTERQNIEMYKDIRQANDAKFSKAVDSSKDPTIRGVFEKTWREKTMQSVNDIENSGLLIERLEAESMNKSREIVAFQRKVEDAGAAFRDRVDARIEKIREKNKYYEWQSHLEWTNDQIEIRNNCIKDLDGKIEEYSDALETAKALGVSTADRKTLEDGIASFRSRRGSHVVMLNKFKKSAIVAESGIADIDQKTKKYDDLKKEMGLDSLPVTANAPEAPKKNDPEDLEDEENVSENNETEPEPEESDLSNIFDDEDEPETEEEEQEEPAEETVEEPKWPETNPWKQPGQNVAGNEISAEQKPVDTEFEELGMGGDDAKKANPNPQANQTVPNVQTQSAARPAAQAEAPKSTPREVPVEGQKKRDDIDLNLYKYQEDEAEDNEEDSETVESGREAAAEALANKAAKLYALITEISWSKMKPAEIYDAAMDLGKTAASYNEAFSPEEDDRLAEGFKALTKKYERRRLPVMDMEETEQFKKDVVKNIIARLPDWVDL